MESTLYGPRATFDDQLHKAIAEQFHIGTITSAEDLGGTYNLNVLLQTTQGSYVMRVYRPWITYQRLSMLHQVKGILYENSLPVVLPIVNKLDKIIVPYQDRFVEVEHFIPYDNVNGTWQHYQKAFALLAKLHTSLATKTGHIAIVPPLIANYGTPDELLAWTLQVEQRIRQPPEDQNAQLALVLCTETVHLLTEMQGKWSSVEKKLPQQMIHGDFRLGNFLFRDEQIVAILDFDFLAIRERIFELAYMLYWMFRRIEGTLPPDKLSWSLVQTMLKSYNSHSIQPLTQTELQVLPLEIARVPLYWIAEASFLSKPEQIIVQLADNVRFARWVVEHRNELVQLFLDA